MLWGVRAVPPSCLPPCPAEFPSSCLSIKLLSRTSHSPDIFRAFLAFCWFPFFFAEPSPVWPRCVLAAVLGFSRKPHERGCLHPRAIARRAQISAQGWRQRDRCSSAARGARGGRGEPKGSVVLPAQLTPSCRGAWHRILLHFPFLWVLNGDGEQEQRADRAVFLQENCWCAWKGKRRGDAQHHGGALLLPTEPCPSPTPQGLTQCGAGAAPAALPKARGHLHFSPCPWCRQPPQAEPVNNGIRELNEF